MTFNLSVVTGWTTPPPPLSDCISNSCGVCCWLVWAYGLTIVSGSRTETTWAHGLFVAPMALTRCNMSLSLAVSQPKGPKKAPRNSIGSCLQALANNTNARQCIVNAISTRIRSRTFLPLQHFWLCCVSVALLLLVAYHGFSCDRTPFQNSRGAIRYIIIWQLAEFIISIEHALSFLELFYYFTTSQYFFIYYQLS